MVYGNWGDDLVKAPCIAERIGIFVSGLIFDNANIERYPKFVTCIGRALDRATKF